MIAIEFENVSKQYRLGLVSTGTLAHDLNRFWQTKILHREDPYLKIGETNDRTTKGHSDYIWALKDINFKVEQGDVVGIIGRNGAGKSTLLKLLSRITSPTTGAIRARGRIASLLEVGTGFHPEMTGRENIYMNGSILGMTKAEITRKLDEIVDFSGCERYLDTPVKRYSSGMSVRLGFAIAAHLDPEILVVDEVLAVGDAEFQKKAIGKMQDIAHGQGRTVLFVSHSMASIKHLCYTGIILENGLIRYMGEINATIDRYMSSIRTVENSDISAIPRKYGYNGNVHFLNVIFLDENGIESSPRCGGYTRIRVYYWANDNYTNCQIAVGIRNLMGVPLLSLPSDLTINRFSVKKGNGYADVIIKKLPLTQGIYNLALWFSTNGDNADWLETALKFNVLDDDFYGTGRTVYSAFQGNIVLCEHIWEINS